MKELSIEEMTSLKGGQQSNTASVSVSSSGSATLSFSSTITNGSGAVDADLDIDIAAYVGNQTLTSILINRMRSGGHRIEASTKLSRFTAGS